MDRNEVHCKKISKRGTYCSAVCTTYHGPAFRECLVFTTHSHRWNTDRFGSSEQPSVFFTHAANAENRTVLLVLSSPLVYQATVWEYRRLATVMHIKASKEIIEIRTKCRLHEVSIVRLWVRFSVQIITFKSVKCFFIGKFGDIDAISTIHVFL